MIPDRFQTLQVYSNSLCHRNYMQVNTNARATYILMLVYDDPQFLLVKMSSILTNKNIHKNKNKMSKLNGNDFCHKAVW